MKKIQKRIFSLFLAVVMAFSLLPATAWAASPPKAEDLAWVNGIVNGLNDDITDPNQQYRPMGTLAMSPSDLYAVQYQRSFATETTFVTETIMFIVPGSGARENYCEIPEYENLNDTPWGRSGATEMYIADGVTGIGDNAFNGMTALEKVVFQDASDLTSIGAHAFSGDNRAVFTDESSQGDTLNLSNVTTMGEYAFSGCSQLGGTVESPTSLKLSDALEEISKGAFNSCGLKTDVQLPSQLKTIGDSAFAGNSLPTVSLPDGLVTIGNSAFSGNPFGSMSTLTIPDSVTTVGDFAFYSSSNRTLNTLNLGTSSNSKLTSIGNSAFLGNIGLATVVIQSEVLNRIDDFAFGSNEYNAFTTQEEDEETGITYLVGTQFQTPNDTIYNLLQDGINCYLGERSPLKLVETVLPTCENQGWRKYTYTWNNVTDPQFYYAYIDPVDHNYVFDHRTKATCTRPQYDVYRCTNVERQVVKTCETPFRQVQVEGSRALGHDYQLTNVSSNQVDENTSATFTFTCANDAEGLHDGGEGSPANISATVDATVLTATTTQNLSEIANQLPDVGKPYELEWSAEEDVSTDLTAGVKYAQFTLTPISQRVPTDPITEWNNKSLTIQVNVERTKLDFSQVSFGNNLAYVDTEKPAAQPATVSGVPDRVNGRETGVTYALTYHDELNYNKDTPPLRDKVWNGKVTATFTYDATKFHVEENSGPAGCEFTVEESGNKGTVTITTDYIISERVINATAEPIENLEYTGRPMETLTLNGVPYESTIEISWTSDKGGNGILDPITSPSDATTVKVAPFTDAGTYTLTITVSKQDYTPDVLENVEVTIGKQRVTVPTAGEYTYDGTEKTGFTVPNNAPYRMTEDTAEKNIQKDAGTYNVAFQLDDTDNHIWADNTDPDEKGLITLSWTIQPKPIPGLSGWENEPSYQYDGSVVTQYLYSPSGYDSSYDPQTGMLTVTWNGEEVFTVTDAQKTNAGDYTCTAKLSSNNFKWEYEDRKEVLLGKWHITKDRITVAEMPTISAADAVYDGEAYDGEVKITDMKGMEDILTLDPDTPYLYYTSPTGGTPIQPINARTAPYYVEANWVYDTQNYSIGSNPRVAFYINKANLTIPTIENYSSNYSGQEQKVKAFEVTDGLVTGDDQGDYQIIYTVKTWDETLNEGQGGWTTGVTYENGTVPTVRDVGRYQISARLESTNYQATIEPYEVTIHSASQTVKLEGAGLTGDGTAENPYSITKTLGDEIFTVTGKGYVGDTVVNEKNIRYEVTASAAADGSAKPVVKVDGNSGAVTLLQAGTATVTVTAAASGNYGEATASYTITVGRGTPTVAVQLPTGGTGEDKNIYSYTGQEREFGAAVAGAAGAVKPSADENSITYTFYRDNSGVKGEKLSGQPTGVGTYWVVATYKGDDNYQEAASEPVQFTISASTLNVTINGHSGVYDGNTHDVATVSSVTGVGKTFSESDYRVTFIEKGEDEGTAPTADDARWTASPVTGVKDVAHSGGYWYKVEVTGADKDNYAPFIDSVTVTITPKRLEVTNTITPRKPYDGTIKATVTFNSINTGIPGETVTAEVTSASYNSADVEKANSITIAYKLTPKEGTNLGNYTLNGTDPITEEAASLSQTVTEVDDTPVGIDKAPITVAITDQEKVYDGTAPAITAPEQGTHWSTTGTIYDQDGQTDDLGITLSVETGGSDAVGEYAIKGAAANTNYDVTFTGSWDGDGVKGQAGTYEVTPRPVEVAIGDALGYYGDDPVLTGVDLTYSKVDGNDNSGLVDDSVPLNLQSNATASSDAGGTYAIYATSNDQRIPLNRATDIDNYRVTVTKDGTYTQQARPITVTALLHSSDYGCPIDGGIANPIEGTNYTVILGTGPAAGGEAIIGEDLAVSLETNATSTSPVGGSYTITPEVTAKEGKLDNYAITVTGAAYTINKARVSFSFAQDILRVNYGTPAQNAITFYNESNGHTAITDSNDIEALQNALQFPQSEEYTITKDGTVTIHNAGVVASVTATLGASANFKAAETGDQFTIIGNQSELVVNVQPVNGLTYTGQPQELVRLTTANLPASVKVYYSTDTGENKQWSEEIPTATNAGEHTVYWKFEDTSGQYVGAGTVHEVTAAIAKADLTASFRNSTPSFTIGDYTSYGEAQNPLTFSPDTEYDKSQITYKSSNPYVAVIDDEHVHQLTIVGTGTTTITATIPGDANRNEATVHYTLTVDASGGMSASAQNVNVPYDGIPHSIAVIVTGAENYTIRYYAAEGNVEQYPSGYPEEENPSFTNAGTYTVFYQVTAPNATARTGRAIITILPRSIDANMVQGIDDEYTYSGNSITPIPTVTDIIDGQQVTLRENVDYTVEYGTNQAVGSGTVTIKGMGNYGGKVEKTFTIRAVDSGEVTASLSSYYGSLDDDPTGAETTVSVKHGSHDVGFTITGVSPEAGTSVGADGKTITFTAHGVYTITVKAGDEQHAEREFTLRYMLMPRTSAGGLSVTLADGLPQVITYGDRFVTSGSIADSIEVKDSNGTPLDTDDYNLTCVYYENPDSDDQGSAAVTVDLDELNGVPDAGMYVVTATGTGSYSPNLSGTFTFLVLQRNLSDSAIDWTVDDSGLTYDAAEQVLNKAQITADFKDKYGNPVKDEDGDPVAVEFVIYDHSNNINAGTDTAYVILQASADSNNFTGTVSVPFSIGKRPITDDANFTITVPDEVSISAGGEARPEVTIYDEVLGRPLTNQDFAVSYSNNDKAGTATVTISGTGNYKGEVTKTFTVVVTSTTFDLTIDKTSWTYGDTANKATSITVTNGGDTLTIGTDYTLSISKDGGTAQSFTTEAEALAYLDRPGTYTVTATGKGSYSFTESETVTISKAQLALEITVTPDTKAGSGTAQIQVKPGTWPDGIDAVFTTLTVQKNGTAQNSLTLTYDAATGAYQPVNFSFGNETVTYTFGVMETEIQNFDPDCYELTITGGRLSVVEQTNNGGGGGGGGTPTAYTITASAGTGGLISPEGTVAVARGDDQSFAIRAADGYHVEEVLVDGKSVGAVTSYTFENVTRNHTIAVTFARGEEIADPDDTGVSDWLNTKDHFAYLNGYGNGLFGPNDNMTRAEAAQMFYNLLLNQNVPVTASFSDVPADAWYARAVNTLASLGIINGVGDNRYEPTRTITRAEFTVIAMRFAHLATGGENIFSDVDPGDWFYDEVVGSIQYGWINGYEDGTFRPNNTITRAEVAAITNRMLGRSADEEYVDAHTAQLRTFGDLRGSYWAYYEIVEATNGHDYETTEGTENWTALAE